MEVATVCSHEFNGFIASVRIDCLVCLRCIIVNRFAEMLSRFLNVFCDRVKLFCIVKHWNTKFVQARASE